MDTAESDARAILFDRERRRLFGLAYRMLGVAAEAEDVVQDAWLRFADVADVRRPEALLTTITSRLAMDRLKSARHRREQYVGPWLPEPLLTDEAADLVEIDVTVTLGLLTVLERLGPVERAVFVLREAFGLSFDEIADVVDRPAASCRQIARRARERVREGRPRFDVEPGHQRELTVAFVDASMNGQVEQLTALLHDDVVLVSDGGAERHAARRPIVGVDRVGRFLTNLAGRRPPETSWVDAEVNGESGVVLLVGDVVVLVIQVGWSAGRIHAINAVRNPDKLAAVGASLRSHPRTSHPLR